MRNDHHERRLRRSHRLRQSGRRNRSGFTLIEMLIGMSLLVMILTALGISMQGAADASRWGNSKSRSLAATTLTINRICSDLRQADGVTVNSANSVTIVLPDGGQHVYSWSGVVGDSIQYIDERGATGAMVDNVELFSVEPVQEFSPVTGGQTTTRVRVTVHVRQDNAETRLSTTVRLRRRI